MATPTLMRLLDVNLRRSPEYGAGLSNHLPMALHALHVLGASDDDLDRFAADYVRRKQLATTPADDGARSESPRLGDFASFPAWHAHFTKRIATDGPRRTLVEALPELWSGVAAAAFHGPIRVAHAWELGHPRELAAALAYWAARWQRVDVAPEAGPTMDMAEWLAAAESAARSFSGDGRLISQRMGQAGRMPAFRAFAGRLRPADDVLATVAQWAAALYADTGNFTVLHVVTGSRALLRLSAVSAPPPDACQALAAAIVASGIGERRRIDTRHCTWDEVVTAARSSSDDHVVKLVHACHELSARVGQDDFLAAACRAVAQRGEL
jgi:hypothetical protein